MPVLPTMSLWSSNRMGKTPIPWHEIVGSISETARFDIENIDMGNRA